MKAILLAKRILAGAGLILSLAGCVFPQAPQQATDTPQPGIAVTLAAPAGTVTLTPGALAGGGSGSSGGVSGGTGGSGGSGGGSGSGSGSSSGGNSTNPGDGPTPTATLPPDLQGGPYIVKQVETLGGEAISGSVCRVTQPFRVNSVTPKVGFVFVFIPQDGTKGKVTYTYSIPSAGESHDASGTYSLSLPDKDGTLHLSLAVSDHVVFKGFDGNIPNRYKFDLVPNSDAGCRPAP